MRNIMFKRGYVYEVIEEGQSMHPVVIMDDILNKQGRIRGDNGCIGNRKKYSIKAYVRRL